jgi:hypothetical protein
MCQILAFSTEILSCWPVPGRLIPKEIVADAMQTDVLSCSEMIGEISSSVFTSKSIPLSQEIAFAQDSSLTGFPFGDILWRMAVCGSDSNSFRCALQAGSFKTLRLESLR